MSIQTRITKRRYGEMNIKAPTKDDLDEYGLRTTRLRKPVPDLFDNIIYQLRFPPKRGIEYNKYILTIELFMEYYNQATKQSQWQVRAQLIDIHLAGKLAYMLDHPNLFHGFQNFKYTWLSNLLFAMRIYIINRKYLLGEIQTTNATKSWSAGFVAYPRPMDNKSMALLADNLYELIYPRMEYIRLRSK